MFSIWLGAAGLAMHFEDAGNPKLDRRIGAAGGNMEGKEVRFGTGDVRPVRRLDDGHIDRLRQLRPRQLSRRSAARCRSCT